MMSSQISEESFGTMRIEQMPARQALRLFHSLCALLGTQGLGILLERGGSLWVASGVALSSGSTIDQAAFDDIVQQLSDTCYVAQNKEDMTPREYACMVNKALQYQLGDFFLDFQKDLSRLLPTATK